MRSMAYRANDANGTRIEVLCLRPVILDPVHTYTRTIWNLVSRKINQLSNFSPEASALRYLGDHIHRRTGIYDSAAVYSTIILRIRLQTSGALQYSCPTKNVMNPDTVGREIW